MIRALELLLAFIGGTVVIIFFFLLRLALFIAALLAGIFLLSAIISGAAWKTTHSAVQWVALIQTSDSAAVWLVIVGVALLLPLLFAGGATPARGRRRPDV